MPRLRQQGRRRRSTPSLIRWIAGFVIVAVFRTVWSSIVFTRHSTSLIGDLDLPRLLAGPASQPLRVSQSKRSKPRKRRPPRVSANSAPSIHSLTVSTSPSVSDRSASIQPRKTSDRFKGDSAYWDYLCGDGNDALSLSSESRVLISGILTHSVASELALLLAKKCSVSTIVGLSDRAPDDPTMAPRLAFLLRKLPGFRLQHRGGPFSQERLEEIVASVRPTHIVHFESTTFLPATSLTNTPGTVSVRSSIELLERLCSAVARYQRQEDVDRVRLLYVSGALSSERTPYESKALELVYPLLLQTFRFHHDIDTTHVTLPNLYGPFHESFIDVKELLSSSDQHQYLNTSSISVNNPTIHEIDSLQSIVASLSRSVDAGSQLPIVKAPKSFSTSFSSLISSFRNSSATKNIGKIENERVRLMLAWHHQDAFPFDDSSSIHGNSTRTLFRKALAMTNQRLSGNKTFGISQMQQRRHNLFPCESECAVNSLCRKDSAFSSVLPLSREVTENCRFVVFTMDLSNRLSDLPLIEENTKTNVTWPKDLLCQIAFVSGRSSLVQKTVKKKQKEAPKKESSEYNGKVQHNRWSLVWLPDNDDTTVSEADYMFPKLSPRSFFSHNVTKSFYVEPKQIDSFPPLPIIWFLLHSQLDAKQTQEKYKRSTKSGAAAGIKVRVPPTPARHVALFVHSFGIPADMVKTSNMDAVAKFVLGRKGLELERPWPRRQLEYYDFVKEFYDFQLVDTFLLIHNLQSDRSRRLRCEWYEEHLFWASDEDQRNRNLEDLSLAYVLAKWRRESRLVAHEDYSEQWGERFVDTAKGDFVEVGSKNMSLSSQYFVKLHAPLKARRMFQRSE